MSLANGSTPCKPNAGPGLAASSAPPPLPPAAAPRRPGWSPRIARTGPLGAVLGPIFRPGPAGHGGRSALRSPLAGAAATAAAAFPMRCASLWRRLGAVDVRRRRAAPLVPMRVRAAALTVRPVATARAPAAVVAPPTVE